MHAALLLIQLVDMRKIHILIKTIFDISFKSTKQIPDYVEKQDALRAKGVSCLNKPIVL